MRLRARNGDNSCILYVSGIRAIAFRIIAEVTMHCSARYVIQMNLISPQCYNVRFDVDGKLEVYAAVRTHGA